MDNLRQYIKKIIKEAVLNYDQMDLDEFTRNHIVGRSFRSEDEAVAYLKSVIGKSKGKKIDDFQVIMNEKDGTLKPYKIYPVPDENDLKRFEAMEYIQKHAIMGSKYSPYAYLGYRHIDKIKELGVKYRFLPIREIDLNGPLQDRLKKDGIGSVLIQDNSYYGKPTILKLFSTPNEMDVQFIKDLRNRTSKSIQNLNDSLGTNFEITKTFAEKTSDSLKRSLTDKLTGEKGNNFETKYKSVSFQLERGDEDDFLAQIPMDGIGKPFMVDGRIW
jgi:hypothetical protein